MLRLAGQFATRCLALAVDAEALARIADEAGQFPPAGSHSLPRSPVGRKVSSCLRLYMPSPIDQTLLGAASALAAAMTNARYRGIGHAGHASHVERPAAFNAAACGFLPGSQDSMGQAMATPDPSAGPPHHA